MRTVLNVRQGSTEWLSARAASDGTASEAPAMMGKSKYMTRTELLQQRKLGIVKEVDQVTQARFDRGHAAEAKARPIAEKIIGDELSPTTIVLEIDGLKLLASLDGITFSDEDIWEHKLLNADLVAAVQAMLLDEHYTIQLDQELLVSGANRCLFMVSDGTEGNCFHMWYETTPEKKQAIIDGWKQFHKDLAEFVPEEIKEKPKAEVIEAFPVPSISVRGELVACNLKDIIPHFDKYLAETKTTLESDEDFANGEANAKASREAAKNLKLTAQAVVDQIAPVSEVVRTLELYAGKFDALGLKLEKAVKEQKESIKNQAIMDARQAIRTHRATLDDEIRPAYLSTPEPDFAAAIKGVKTIATMRDRINTALAQGKAAMEAEARDIRTKLNWFNYHAAEHKFLFNDLHQIIGKPSDDFGLLVKTRISEYQNEQNRKLEEERERVRLKAEADARAKVEAEAREKAKAEEQAAAAAKADSEQQAENYQPALSANEVIRKVLPSDLAAAVATEPQVAEVSDTGARLKLGQISGLLGFTVNEAFMKSIGFEAEKDRSAALYRECDFPAICEAVIRHVNKIELDFLTGLKKAA